MSLDVAAAETWVPDAHGSGWDVDHLPYGVFSAGDDCPRVGTRVGPFVLDLAPLAALEMHPAASALADASLDSLLRLEPSVRRSIRPWVVELLTTASEQDAVDPFLVPVDEVRMHHPFTVADFVDFFCSLHHASTVGRIARPDADPLSRSWRHLPAGYHGRAGTVVASGTPVVRPVGQGRPSGDGSTPTFGPTRRLDLEAELGFVVGTGTSSGERVATDDFAHHVVGVTLVNDWSARDVQGWESAPLGPFLGKSFATSMSTWITPLEALASARIDLPVQDPAPLPYLEVGPLAGYDVEITVAVNGSVVATCPYAETYWSPAQMLAHLTVNGAALRPGDLFASGTVSGPEPHQRGCLLELTWGGRDPVKLDDGTTRTFLEDGDTVTLSATAPGALGGRIRLGDVTGTVEPARR